MAKNRDHIEDTKKKLSPILGDIPKTGESLPEGEASFDLNILQFAFTFNNKGFVPK